MIESKEKREKVRKELLEIGNECVNMMSTMTDEYIALIRSHAVEGMDNTFNELIAEVVSKYLEQITRYK